jgi:hypothetical protein
MKKHYKFDTEGAEFEAGIAVTGLEVQYTLDCISDGIQSLDYKKPEHEQLLRKLRDALVEAEKILLDNPEL